MVQGHVVVIISLVPALFAVCMVLTVVDCVLTLLQLRGTLAVSKSLAGIDQSLYRSRVEA